MPEIRNTLDIPVNFERWWKDGWEGFETCLVPVERILRMRPLRAPPTSLHDIRKVPTITITSAWHDPIIRKVPTLTQVVTITYRSGNVNVQKLCIVGWGLVSWFNIMVEVLRELKVIHEQALCINTEGLNQPSPNHHHRWSMMILIICKVHGPNRHHRQIITIHQTNDIGFIRADEGIRCAEFNRCTLWPFYEHFVPPL